MRFYLFDRILEAERGKRMVATKLVTLMDEYLTGHYPRAAVMPPTLLVEALAQVGGMLNVLNHDFRVQLVLMLVDGVRVYRQVRPGDLLSLEVHMLYDHPYGASMRGAARIGAEVALSIERLAFAHEEVRDEGRVQLQRERFQYQSGGFPLPEASAA